MGKDFKTYIMKKLIYLFLTILITLSVSAQDLNKTNDGYTEVVSNAEKKPETE